ncbi:cold-regulated protein 28 isoform X2 [Benincasa hispida]|uniref:cold-regulated protein 28 isoform X2 n=1 Tax=Benincasa hispida TaxID=102211 RepID=UPI001901FC1B|nr:cold-regulated protein 28 isoform X2 [Benincasa hispida]
MGHSHTQSSISPPPLPDRRQSLMPPSASDSTRSISQSVSSSITLDGSNPFLYSHHSLQLDAEQTHWTDEKHRLYLDSLEASFVQGLHQHRRRHALSMEQKMHWKPFMPNISSSEVRQHIHSKIGRKQCTPEIPDVLEECGSCSDRRHLRNTSNSCGSARSSQQIPPCCRDSNIIITEVSDQNFVDDHPRELSGGIPIAKRLKKVSSDSSGNDQVVPYKRSSQTS